MAPSTRLDRAALAGTLRKQHDVVARDQTLAAGMSRAALRHRLQPGGPWQVLLPGVYVAVTGAVTADQRDVAALLYAGHRSVITGHAALRRHGLGAAPPDVVDILTPVAADRRSSGFARLQRTRRMPGQVCVTGEIRFALVPRAVADAARAMTSLRDVTDLVAGVVQRRHCPLSLLARELEEGPTRGSALLRHAMEQVADGIRSVAEGDFRTLLKRARLPMPMFNARLYDGASMPSSTPGGRRPGSPPKWIRGSGICHRSTGSGPWAGTRTSPPVASSCCISPQARSGESRPPSWPPSDLPCQPGLPVARCRFGPSRPRHEACLPRRRHP
jgi:hypothetical protein